MFSLNWPDFENIHKYVVANVRPGKNKILTYLLYYLSDIKTAL